MTTERDAERAAGSIADTFRDFGGGQAALAQQLLPFAQTGAGDFYCLMPQEASEPGVALIWHDREYACVGYRSFNGLVHTQLLQVFADLSHLVEDGFSEADATPLRDRDRAFALRAGRQSVLIRLTEGRRV